MIIVRYQCDPLPDLPAHEGGRTETEIDLRAHIPVSAIYSITRELTVRELLEFAQDKQASFVQFGRDVKIGFVADFAAHWRRSILCEHTPEGHYAAHSKVNFDRYPKTQQAQLGPPISVQVRTMRIGR